MKLVINLRDEGFRLKVFVSVRSRPNQVSLPTIAYVYMICYGRDCNVLPKVVEISLIGRGVREHEHSWENGGNGPIAFLGNMHVQCVGGALAQSQEASMELPHHAVPCSLLALVGSNR